MTAAIDHAIAWARKGKAILPCNPAVEKRDGAKVPYLPAEKDTTTGEKIPKSGGLYKASVDEVQVRSWWTTWPEALIGIRTGKINGFFIVDLDPEDVDIEGIRAQIEENIGCSLPRTFAVGTPRGGVDLYFKTPLEMPAGYEIGCHTGIIKHVDVRGEGGYGIAPGSARADGKRYEVIVDADIAEPPAALVDWVKKPLKEEYGIDLNKAARQGEAWRRWPEHQKMNGAILGAMLDESIRKYLNAALTDEENLMRRAPEGQRNHQLNKSAFALGRYGGAGVLSETLARSILLDAAAGYIATDGPEAAEKTFKSGWSSGFAKPADLSHIGKGYKANGAHNPNDPSADNPPETDAEEQAESANTTGNSERVYDPWAEYHAPVFPLDLLPQAFRDFVEAKAVETGADISAVAMAALAVASAALTHEATLYLKPGKNFPVSPRLWVLNVGPPSAKKSPAMAGAVAPLQKAQHSPYTEWAARKRKAKKDKIDFDEPPPPQYVAHDTTSEKMADILSHQGRGILCFHDELSSFIGALDRYGTGKGASSERAFWLKAYDGGPFNIQRIGRETVPINNLSVSILGGIQPSRLREFKGLSSDGLLQRFLPIMMRKPQLDSDFFNSGAREDWEMFIAELLTYGRFSTDLTLDARKVRGEIREYLFTGSQTESEGEAFQGFVGKLDGVWGNLCLLMHIIWGKRAADQVSADTAKMASRLIKEFVLPHALAFYRSVAGSAQQDHKAIGACIASFGEETIKVRDFARGPGCFRGLASDEVAKMVGPFVAGGWLAPLSPGPYCTAWRINPAVRASFEHHARQHAEWVQALQAKIAEKENIS